MTSQKTAAEETTVKRVWIFSGVTHETKQTSRYLGWDHNLPVMATYLFFVVGQADQDQYHVHSL